MSVEHDAKDFEDALRLLRDLLSFSRRSDPETHASDLVRTRDFIALHTDVEAPPMHLAEGEKATWCGAEDTFRVAPETVRGRHSIMGATWYTTNLCRDCAHVYAQAMDVRRSWKVDIKPDGSWKPLPTAQEAFEATIDALDEERYQHDCQYCSDCASCSHSRCRHDETMQEGGKGKKPCMARRNGVKCSCEDFTEASLEGGK